MWSWVVTIGFCDNIHESYLPASQISDNELCCICFDQVCTIEVQDCGHQMCAQCTLALCCHNKPNPTTMCPVAPVCPFCRSTIAHLSVAKIKTYKDEEPEYIFDASPSTFSRLRKSFNFSEGSSSFKGLSAFGKMGGGRGSGRIAAESDEKAWTKSVYSFYKMSIIKRQSRQWKLCKLSWTTKFGCKYGWRRCTNNGVSCRQKSSWSLVLETIQLKKWVCNFQSGNVCASHFHYSSYCNVRSITQCEHLLSF